MNLRRWASRLIGGADDLDRLPTLIHVSSAGINPLLATVGSSPFGLVDAFDTFMQVPPRQTEPRIAEGNSNRYLLRLCGITIPAGHAARLIAVGEYTEIGYQQVQQSGAVVPVICPVVTPGWTFVDGNVSRGITVIPPTQNPDVFSQSGAPVSTTRNVQGITPALCFEGASPVPYLAPAGGRFPGSPLEGLGLWRDNRFRWGFASSPLDYAIEGPGSLVYWCSVRQTDPGARPALQLDPGADIGALCPEDRFLQLFPLAAYSRVGGFMVIEHGPNDRFARRRRIPEEGDPCPP